MYINSMLEDNKNYYIEKWLLLITFLVALMIVIGGLTRLTDSGLSITKWNLISGILPPLSLSQWENTFDLYKKIPEYKILNSTMTLNEFKYIFWWEYIHRLLGRIVGILYLFPLIFFTFKQTINKNKLFELYAIFLLIFIQGLMGWYMVKSGLTENTDVSHYRLSIHLTLAFIIFLMLLWNYLKFKKKNYNSNKSLPPFLLYIFLICLIIQISLGALVSGLDGGQIYQTWPLMNQNYFPDDSNIKDLFSTKVFETPSILQFIHRNIAYFIILLFSFISIIVYKNKDFTYLRNTTLLVLAFLLLQTFLGIFTVLSGAQIFLASMHQIGSIFLITTTLILVFKNSNTN